MMIIPQNTHSSLYFCTVLPPLHLLHLSLVPLLLLVPRVSFLPLHREVVAQPPRPAMRRSPVRPPAARGTRRRGAALRPLHALHDGGPVGRRDDESDAHRSPQGRDGAPTRRGGAAVPTRGGVREAPAASRSARGESDVHDARGNQRGLRNAVVVHDLHGAPEVEISLHVVVAGAHGLLPGEREG